MSDDPRVTVPAELVDALREVVTNTRQFAAPRFIYDAARALVDAAERPAAPVSEPLCRCGHRHPFDPSGTYASQGPPCEGYWTRCRCTKYTPTPPPVPVSDEAEAQTVAEAIIDAIEETFLPHLPSKAISYCAQEDVNAGLDALRERFGLEVER